MLENIKKQIFTEEGIEKDENGNFLFDASKFEVGIVEGKLVIAQKKDSPVTEDSDSAENKDRDDSATQEVTSEAIKIESKKTGTKKNSELSEQDLREARALFGK